MNTPAKASKMNDRQAFPEIGIFGRCMMAFACLFMGSLQAWVARDFWGMATGVSFAGFVAIGRGHSGIMNRDYCSSGICTLR
jgi:hypothetical protein